VTRRPRPQLTLAPLSGVRFASEVLSIDQLLANRDAWE